MQDLRIILIILGAVAIAALLIHGLWTSQKGRQKNIGDKPINKVANQTEDQVENDPDGFDSDGIGSVRVVSSNHQAASLVDDANAIDDWHETPHFSAVNEDEDDEPQLGLPPRLSKSTFSGAEKSVLPESTDTDKAPAPEKKASDAALSQDAVITDTTQSRETDAEQRVRRYQEGEIDPLFDEPKQTTSEADEPYPEPPQSEPEAPLATSMKDSALLDAEQAEPEEVHTATPQDDVESKPEPMPEPAKPLREVPKTWQDVYVINLVARPNKQLQGQDLIRALTQADFSFGEMDIFHRYQNANAQGEPLFSLINMVQPGTFNPNAMAEFSTPGVSVFMQLPQPGMAKNQFNLMIQAAENMAETLDAILLDGQRRPLSPDYLAQCREQLRDFDSQVQ
ncbi:cell division protein ZipA [Oceanisphaera pacifica]|uniref:Cell division protein ZipA n=1 Tax=Oceanisphaera pacifica TaxID=2818389 RepID=A0ABS3NEN4_9GAMM|nr:cell division protein ZipA [Oceanisphaera pacifica]MBO1518995.1 cell division protein ZipA [Oceanisphaera pacifica]